MAYDPFARGSQPVGVTTVELVDPRRDRKLTAEVWYPAAPAHAGADLDAATRDRYVLMPGFPEPWQLALRGATPAGGRFPLAIFSHGFGGHRRQSTFLATHLASHGWAVAAVDHAGNTFMDLLTARDRPVAEVWRSSMADRPLDVRFLIDAASDGRLGVAVDPARVAMTGHSFGGWTAIRVIADEPRIAAVVALTPAIGVTGLREALDPAARSVPTLVIAAARDSILPLAGLEEGFARLRPPADLVVIEGTDHLHFCDNPRLVHEQFRAMPIQLVPLATPLPPFAELAPGAHGHDPASGLGLAHLDAVIRDDADARAFRAEDPATTLGRRGIVARATRR